MSTSKLKPKQSIYFDKSTEEEVKQPAAYLPESYRQDFKRSNKKNTKKSIVEEKEDSDAEGSIEVLEEQELIIQPSTSNQQTKKSNQSLAKDPLPFTLSPQVYRTSRSTAPKDKKKTRRIALGSSDEEDVRPIPAKKDKKRTRRRIDSESDDDHQISIIKSKQKKKPKLVQKKRPRLASSSSGSTTNDESEEETTEEEEEEDEEDADCSIAIISGGATRKSSRPATKKLRRKIDLPLSDPGDDDDDQNLGSEQDEWKRARSEVPGSDEDDGGNHHQGVSEIDALEFFNSCNVIDLPAVTACTLDQAKIIVSCRPFINADDMKSKLRKKKGVNSGILNHYQDMMKGYFEVDRVLSKCEKHGRDLSSIMDIWANRVQSTSSNAASSKKEEEEEGATDLVNHLTDAQGLRTEEEKRAFNDYIYTQPETVPKKITLKSYQMLGINWMNLLYSKGLSCILADEMGLGKTAQVVCFLSHLKSTGQIGPHLVVVPSSTLENWKREFGNFSNNLTVREYYGSQMERMDLRYELKSMPDLDVVITTYNIATGTVEDRKFLDRMKFDACVYDEGHQLKNSQSKRYKDLMRMKVRWRLLLTGTPLQNNLQELVSLLSFILPKIFGGQAQNDLRMIFKVPSDAQVNLLALTRITRAKKMMSPFVLRRKKIMVLQDLPKKIEKVIYCDLEPNQSDAYNQLIKKSKKYLLESSDTIDQDEEDEEEEQENFKNNGLLGGKSKKNVVDKKKKKIANSTTNVLMELRKLSNHPLLFRRLYDQPLLSKIAKSCLNEVDFFDSQIDLIIEDLEVMSDFEIHRFCSTYKNLKKFILSHNEFFNSGKIKTLQNLLSENLLKDKNGENDDNKPSRFLIFSQFTMMLDILEVVLNHLNVKFLVLTGQTNVTERQSLVDEFTNDPTITVFLLSTRAGGLGLNLMAADTVIIFDQDFNPHNDRQAEDRAYRLGQTRDVKVFKLISKGTIEEDILQLASTKIEIDNSISSTIPPPAAGTTETTTPVTIIGSSHTTLTNNKNKEDDDIEVLQSNSTLNTQTQTQPSSSSSTTITSTPQAENSLKKSLINRFRKRVLSNNDP
ncbi:hypothetical protein MJO29_012460 [Puccinia striiformis f. sp. tritici]|nr:hypothetical protein MJO29_012460 [Puccinia striiformis f. sp. tritici]